MNGLEKFISDVAMSYPYIVLAVCIILYIIYSIKKYNKMSEEEKNEEQERLIKIALEKVKEIIPFLTANAEENWNHLVKSGIIKRGEVIDAIYEKYPILKEYYDQEKITAEIDKIIDEALVNIRSITRNNTVSYITESTESDGEVNE